MLLKKPHSEGDVVSVKLTSEIELIARLVREESKSVTVSKPMRVVNDMRGGVGLMDWIMLGDSNEVTIDRSHIYHVSAAIKEFADQYTESTTGIALR